MEVAGSDLCDHCVGLGAGQGTLPCATVYWLLPLRL